MAIIKYRESPGAEWQELPVVNKVSMKSLPEDVFTGNCMELFKGGGWDWFIDYFGSNITTKDITNLSGMFYNCKWLEEIPFELNCKEGSTVDCGSMFNYCEQLKAIPKINNCKPSEFTSLFAYCYNLRELPEDLGDWFDWSHMDAQTYQYNARQCRMFENCYSLRSVPMGFLEHGKRVVTSGGLGIYYFGFSYCNALDELVDLPYPHYNSTWTANDFYNTFLNCTRLKNMTFKTPDGAPYVVNWKNQAINLSANVGYGVTAAALARYNSGITADKEVKDDATYQALKNDPDWFTNDIAYSRYNHDSAVATINSLPDASAYLATAGGANTIQFKGAAGSKTDGGAINTLTDAEIAVAAAKGWTVSLV